MEIIQFEATKGHKKDLIQGRYILIDYKSTIKMRLHDTLYLVDFTGYTYLPVLLPTCSCQYLNNLKFIKVG